jgi:hypothetical protein
VALKREIQVNKYTTDTGTRATLFYVFFENIDFNVILCMNVTKDVLKYYSNFSVFGDLKFRVLLPPFVVS